MPYLYIQIGEKEIMKFRFLVFIFILLGILKLPAYSKALRQAGGGNVFDDCITIDGRTYKVSPDFTIPAGIDRDSPVKLIFSDETHELLNIERMTDDDTDNDQLDRGCPSPPGSGP